jgi:hydrogenase maturation protease
VTESVVVGIGQPSAGDDGVGIAVARSLAARGLEVRESSDASVILDCLGERRRVVLVDAAAGDDPPGTVLRLDPTDLASGALPVSTHGLGVADALELARVLYGEEALRGVSIVAVVIERPPATRAGLSLPVAGAVERAAALAYRLAGGDVTALAAPGPGSRDPAPPRRSPPPASRLSGRRR